MWKIKFYILMLLLCGIFSTIFAQEQITITTYYPSPFGSYRELRTNRMAVSPTRAMPVTDGELAWGDNRGLLSPDQGASIELGGAGNPYIDFSNDMAADFDFRIVLNDNDNLTIRGGRTAFTNDDGTPATIRTGEVWYCTQY